MRNLLAFTVLLSVAAANVGCAQTDSAPARKPSADSAFTALQERGKVAMGVDQYTSSHTFDALPDGGRIELTRAAADTAGVSQIRKHMREIARAFKAGDFSTPAFVHMREVPGVPVMTKKRDLITYEARNLPGGAEVVIKTSDLEALQAIHDFVAFQRQDHHASGMVHGKESH